MAKFTGYRVEWVATFLHDFPHINFQFETTNSTFNPNSSTYREALVFLAAIPVVWCVLVLLATSCCLCFHCCKEKPRKKRSTTGLRCTTALFIIFSIGSVAVGFFGNEEGNKGIQSTVEALQDTNETLSNSISTLSTLDSLTQDITDSGIPELKNVFNDHLREKNATLWKEAVKLADKLANQSLVVRKDVVSIQEKVSKINLDQILNLTQKVEFNRWLYTILLFCWQIVLLLIYIVGTLKKSKCWIVCGIVLGCVSMFLAWVAAGVYVAGTVGVSDFCVAPNTYVVSQLKGELPIDIVNSYIECNNKTDPQKFSKMLEDALMYVNNATQTLNTAVNKTKPYDISKYLAGPVKKLHSDLTQMKGDILSLSDTVFCGHIHSNYIKALTGLCNRSVVGMALILLVLPILGFSLIMIQCFAPRIWLLLGKRKGYRVVDDSDPFLPRPPPYNDYGAMGDKDFRRQESNYLEDSVMSDAPRPGSMASGDSPPPAYYPGSFVEQYNNLGTFPRPSRPT